MLFELHRLSEILSGFIVPIRRNRRPKTRLNIVRNHQNLTSEDCWTHVLVVCAVIKCGYSLELKDLSAGCTNMPSWSKLRRIHRGLIVSCHLWMAASWVRYLGVSSWPLQKSKPSVLDLVCQAAECPVNSDCQKLITWCARGTYCAKRSESKRVDFYPTKTRTNLRPVTVLS